MEYLYPATVLHLHKVSQLPLRNKHYLMQEPDIHPYKIRQDSIDILLLILVPEFIRLQHMLAVMNGPHNSEVMFLPVSQCKFHITGTGSPAQRVGKVALTQHLACKAEVKGPGKIRLAKAIWSG